MTSRPFYWNVAVKRFLNCWQGFSTSRSYVNGFQQTGNIHSCFQIKKKGDKSGISNYRGITFLSACSKVFEIIKWCTFYLLPAFYFKWSKWILSETVCHHQSDSVYFNMYASNGCRTSGRCYLFGLKSRLWQSWPSHTSGATVENWRDSQLCRVSGLPQGSNPGPLLFLRFINGVTLILPPGVRFYADDAKLYIVVTTAFSSKWFYPELRNSARITDSLSVPKNVRLSRSVGNKS